MAKKTPINITDANESHEADINSRETRYLISMAIRVVCFILAIVCSGWLRWIFAAGAVVLPWVAVLIANNRAEPARESSANFTGIGDYAEVEAPQPDESAAPDDDVVLGEIIRPLEAGGDSTGSNDSEHDDGRQDG